MNLANHFLYPKIRRGIIGCAQARNFIKVITNPAIPMTTEDGGESLISRRWGRELFHRSIGQSRGKKFVPQGSDNQARHPFRHWRIIIVSHPGASDEIRSIANHPGVAM